jgi:hypothetical protein
MPKGKYFDLMKEKPSLDIPTLNYVWDWVWRMNAVQTPKNANQRARQGEREYILQLLQDMAGRELNAE